MTNTDTLFSRCLKPIILEKSIHPCGQCILCRRKKMLEWILRGTHELNTNNNEAIFVTLTYKPRYLPKEGYNGNTIVKKAKDDRGGNLRPIDMTLFFKRLRKYIGKNLHNKRIKYIYCGEYGQLRIRPHYHAIIFGLTPTDISEEQFQKIWGMGKVVVDKACVTEHGIQYTVGYCSKKVIDQYTKRESYYKQGRIPPYLRCSKGIGAQWAIDNRDTFIDVGYISHKGGTVPIPRYYLKVLQRSEARIIKYKSTIAHLDISGKIERTTCTRVITNPNGKYTNKIWDFQRADIVNKIQVAEQDVQNEHYFEIIGFWEDKLREHDKRILRAHKQWAITERYTDKELAKMLEYKRFKKEKLMDEWESQAKSWDLHTILSKEKLTKDKEQAKLKIHIILNGLFGKRQAMELNQDLLQEGI